MWLSIYNKEWDITVIQPISSTSTSELFKKALVDIWIDLYLIKFQFLAILCVFVFLSLEEFFITGVQSCPYRFNSKPLGLGRICFLTGSSCLFLHIDFHFYTCIYNVLHMDRISCCNVKKSWIRNIIFLVSNSSFWCDFLCLEFFPLWYSIPLIHGKREQCKSVSGRAIV